MEYFIYDIITKVRTKLQTLYDLRSIRTWEIGIFSDLVAFPVISIIPFREQPVKYFSGGLYTVRFQFDIEIYHKGLTLLVVKNESQKASDAIIKQLRIDNFWTFDDYVFKAEINEPVTLSNASVSNGNANTIVSSIIRITLEAKYQKRNDLFLNVAGSYVSDSSSSNTLNLQKKIVALFEDYRTTYKTETFGISEVRDIKQVEQESYSTFPILIINDPILNLSYNTLAGLLEHKYEYVINLITKALPDEAHLEQHLELATKIQRLIVLYDKLSLNGNGILSDTTLFASESELHQAKIIDSNWLSTTFLINPEKGLFNSEIKGEVMVRDFMTPTLPDLTGVILASVVPANGPHGILGSTFVWSGVVTWDEVEEADSYQISSIRHSFYKDGVFTEVVIPNFDVTTASMTLPDISFGDSNTDVFWQCVIKAKRNSEVGPDMIGGSPYGMRYRLP